MDNLNENGIAVRRYDMDGAKGRKCRLRGGLVIKGEIVEMDLGGADAGTSIVNIAGKDLGTADAATLSDAFCTVRPLQGAAEGKILGVALADAADDAEVDVCFGDSEFGDIVKMYVERDTEAVAAGNELVADSTTVTGLGLGSPGGVGKVIAIALEASAAAGASGRSLIRVLFKGVSGFGFRQT